MLADPIVLDTSWRDTALGAPKLLPSAFHRPWPKESDQTSLLLIPKYCLYALAPDLNGSRQFSAN